MTLFDLAVRVALGVAAFGAAGAVIWRGLRALVFRPIRAVFDIQETVNRSADRIDQMETRLDQMDTTNAAVAQAQAEHAERETDWHRQTSERFERSEARQRAVLRAVGGHRNADDLRDHPDLSGT